MFTDKRVYKMVQEHSLKGIVCVNVMNKKGVFSENIFQVKSYKKTAFGQDNVGMYVDGSNITVNDINIKSCDFHKCLLYYLLFRY